MPVIRSVRPVLLSAPYGSQGNAEVLLHLPHGMRTTGLVEIAFDTGIVGLGEGYLAVFAPHVFAETVRLLAPIVVGRSLADLPAIVRDVEIATGYWSFQGAARHVVSAIETALQDARAQSLGVPLWQALGGKTKPAMPVYASGGDSISPEFMVGEFAEIASLGIKTFKIRSRKHQADKAIWCARNSGDIAIAVDMTQNLAIPSQTPDEVLAFLSAHDREGVTRPAFLEEVQGPMATAQLPALRKLAGVPIAGGEIITTPGELATRLSDGCYDIVQPDATVIGGVGPVLEVFAKAREAGAKVYVHCWGAGVGMLANYHAAAARAGDMVEWPLPAYPLRQALFAEQVAVRGGLLELPDVPGLGAKLTPEIERAFPFREDTVYRCLVDPSLVPTSNW